MDDDNDDKPWNELLLEVPNGDGLLKFIGIDDDMLFIAG